MKRPRRAGAVAFLLLLVAPALFGQAWVAPRGETTVSLTFQIGEFKGHLDENGNRIPLGGSRSRTMALDVEHSLTDRLAITAGLPYVAGKNGRDPSPAAGRTGIDDGRYHSTWQDFRLGARYNILTHPIVVTPLILFRIPSHSYHTIGEAAVGRNLREEQLGIAVARIFAPADQTFYVEGQYTYTVVQKHLNVGTNRSNADLDLGYFVLPTLNVRAFVNWQDTYGGLEADFVFSPDIPADLFHEHDRLLQDDHWRGGVGASYAITENVEVYLSFLKTLRGTNSHFGNSYSVGIARSFGKSH